MRPDFVTAAYPVWSPDGKGLLFLGNRDKKLPEKDSIDWWVTPLDSGPVIKTGALEATRTAKLEGAFPVHPWMLVAPAWQPDGDSLVFSARSGDSRNLWRIGISVKTWKVTGPPQRLTSGRICQPERKQQHLEPADQAERRQSRGRSATTNSRLVPQF